MDDATREHRTPAVGAELGVTVRRLSMSGLATLRLFRPTDAEVLAASAALGFELALAANTSIAGPPRTLRLGPGEWLIERSAPILELERMLGGMLHHLSDVAPGRVRWSVEGSSAADLLQCGCNLDLDLEVFAAGAGARTVLADVGVVISRPDGRPRFEVLGDRADADHLQAWFDDALIGFAACP